MTIDLDKLSKYTQERCKEAVDALTAVLNDPDDSFSTKVKAIVHTGHMIEKLNLLSEFSTYRWIGSDIQPNEEDRMNYIVVNKLSVLD